MNSRMTCQPILDALNSIYEIEWGKFANDFQEVDPESNPPYVLWRFKSPENVLVDELKNLIGAFKGKVEWSMESLGRNWIIAPKVLIEFIYESRNLAFAQALRLFSDGNFEIIRLGYNDIECLADLIDKKLSKNSNFSKET
jgi:hypothetical protein